MAHIKAFFKGISSEEKAKFKDSQCLLTISVGQASHESERFAATVNLINDHFKGCKITLHDELQRYTMALDRIQDPAFFHEIAIKEGDLWLKRNKKHYEYLTKFNQIIRWSEWLNHPNFCTHENNVKSLTEKDPSYKAIFNDTINEFLNRYRNRLTDLSNFNQKRAWNLCFDYLVEECAVMCLWPETKCHFEIYAGKHNLAIEETRKRFIYSKYPELLHNVPIRFNHRADLEAQHFELLEVYS